MKGQGAKPVLGFFGPANQYAKGTNLTQYDETINMHWRDQVREYTAGNKSREQALKDFKQQVADNPDMQLYPPDWPGPAFDGVVYG